MSFEVLRFWHGCFLGFSSSSFWQCCLPSASGQSNKGFVFILKFSQTINLASRSQWQRGLRRKPAAARLLGLWVRIPPGSWISLCCECRVLSGRGLCDGLITRPEESYRLWWVVVCDLETSWMRWPWSTGALLRQKQKQNNTNLDRFKMNSNFTSKCRETLV